MTGEPISRTLNSAGNPWRTLGVLCLGYLMVVVDSTIVNVALPGIKSELGLSSSSVVWVVNVYLLTFASFLIPGGRLGDLLGKRRLFLLGMTGFTAASLVCGLTRSQELLITARALQGASSAVLSAVSLSLITNLFTENAARVKALAVYAFVSTIGEGAGLILGGLVTGFFNWHWIFLMNIPFGAAIIGFARTLSYGEPNALDRRVRLDFGGIITSVAILALVTYATVNIDDLGRIKTSTLVEYFMAAVLAALFVAIETRAQEPIVSPKLFTLRNLLVSNLAIALFSAAIYICYFTMSLYLQLVLEYSAFESSLAFLPASALTAVVSLKPCVRVMVRFGVKQSAFFGLTAISIGLMLLAKARANGTIVLDVIPGMALVGLGGGSTATPLYLAALSELEPKDAGVVSGIVGTSSVFGALLGLAVTTRISAAQTRALLASGESLRVAMTGGYSTALLVAAALTFAGAVVVIILLRGVADSGAHASKGAAQN